MSDEKDKHSEEANDNPEQMVEADGADQGQPEELETQTVVDEKPKQASSLATSIALLALLIALAAAGSAGWLWQQLQQNKQALNQTVIEQGQSSQDKSQQLQSDISLLNEQLNTVDNELGTKLSEQNKQVIELESNVETALSSSEHVAQTITALHSKLNINPKTGWLIAEAEYLLSIANQQLQLAGDVDTSIVALRSADQRLRESGDPTVLDVRAIIADEIGQLQSIQVTDIAGAALTLASMQSRVNELSLAGQGETFTDTDDEEATEEEKQTNKGWRSGLNTAWSAVKDLVVIRKRGDSDIGSPLLSPDQRALIYQNLRLKLESARLSLIQGDETTYRQSLDITNQWLVEYFDNDAKRHAVEDTLNELSQIKLTPAMPDISASLDALRSWQHQQSNNAE